MMKLEYENANLFFPTIVTSLALILKHIYIINNNYYSGVQTEDASEYISKKI